MTFKDMLVSKLSEVKLNDINLREMDPGFEAEITIQNISIEKDLDEDELDNLSRHKQNKIINEYVNMIKSGE